MMTIASALGKSIVAELWPGTPYEIADNGGPGVIGFAFQAQSGVDAIGSDRMRPFQRRTNTVAWIPPGCSMVSRSPIGGEYLVVRGIGITTDTARPLNDVVQPDAVAAAFVLRRWAISGQGSPESSLAAVDVLSASIQHRLDRGLDPANGWLTPARLTIIDRLIDARMADGPSVAALAGAVGLSVGFLVVVFRAGLGTTPHRYVVERRLARARQELVGTRQPIATIAAACGFADQAHLTRSMRATLGVTPAAYRRRAFRQQEPERAVVGSDILAGRRTQ